MTRAFLTLLTLILFPWQATAQVIDVRAGDHDGFTRLVFALPAGANWSLDRSPSEDAYVLQVEGDASDFRIDQVFARIDRNRVAELTPIPGASSLKIDLACDCKADASVLAERMLIVDVSPALADAGREEELGRPIAADAVNPADIPQTVQDAALNQAVAPDHAQGDDHVAAEPVPESGLPDAADLAEIRMSGTPGIGPGKTPQALMPGVPLIRPALPDPSPVDAAALPGDVSQPKSIGAQIIADLAAAATQGLLDPAIQQPPLVAPTPAKPAAEEPQESRGLAEQLAEGLAGLDHDLKNDRHLVIGGVNCLPDKSLRIMDWAPQSADPFEYLSSTRSAVFGEFDRVDPSALQTHMMAQIHYGFGAEARVSALLDEAAQTPTLVALSYLVDLEDDLTNIFARQTGCEGSASLWSLLDMATLPKGDSINTNAVLRSFEALPKVLREHLGPTLAEQLSKFGETDTARDLLRRLERSSGEETDKIALGRAKLDVHEGKAGDAARTLQELAFTAGPNSIEAIVTAADLAERTGEKVPKVMVELAAAYATEMRNTDAGPTLWQTHLRMLLLNGEFDQAFVVLEDSRSIPKDTAHDMGDHMLEALLDSEDEVSFLKYAFRLDATGHRTTQPELDLAVARRMLDLGLSEAVLERLDRIDIDESTREVRLLRARAYLQLFQPEEAESYLVGLSGPEPDALRAEIRALMGDFESARTAFDKTGQTDAALQAAWLAGDWEGVAAADGSVLAPAAALIDAEQTTVDPQALSLRDAEQLTAESSSARDTLRALLEATRIPQED